jgi:hypothetical protein
MSIEESSGLHSESPSAPTTSTLPRGVASKPTGPSARALGKRPQRTHEAEDEAHQPVKHWLANLAVDLVDRVRCEGGLGDDYPEIGISSIRI